MGKRIRCADVGPDCDFEAWAETEEELMEMVVLHAKQAHGMEEIPPEMVEQVRSAIQDA